MPPEKRSSRTSRGKRVGGASHGAAGSSDAKIQKKPTRYIGDLRRSAASSTFGPGAIGDFRTKDGAAISVVLPCADNWTDWADLESVYDPRLQQLLGVSGFRLPPVVKDSRVDGVLALPGVRFPVWLHCTSCHRLDRAPVWLQQDGDAGRYCATCSGSGAKAKRIYAVPVRFIIACESGHLGDFPWETWLDGEHEPACDLAKRKIKLKNVGAGLRGLRVSCSACSATRGMSEAFNKEVTASWRCAGQSPWLGGPPAACDGTVQVVQRGASNLYFPLVRSSLLIPPWDSDIEVRIGDRWADLLDAPSENRSTMLRAWIQRGSVDVPPGQTSDEFVASALAYAESRESRAIGDIRREEWESLRHAAAVPSREFELRREIVPSSLHAHLSSVVRVVRLRELRALYGFTRIVPPPSSEDPGAAVVCRIFRNDVPKWFPAVEVRGEGIFLSLNDKSLATWEAQPAVERRRRRIWNAWCDEYAQRFGRGAVPERPLTSRFLLIHALSHALLQQLSLECGYSAASLRERIYSADPGAGALIYTATSDSDGTLGGLERQGLAARLEGTLRSALESMRWCSSDPLCISGAMMASNACNLACCHACMLAPETSCEEFNRFLDRALLVGTPENPEIGFFYDLLAGTR